MCLIHKCMCSYSMYILMYIVRIYIIIYLYVVMENKLPHLEYEQQNLDSIPQEVDFSVGNTLHGTRTIMSHFVDDYALFNMSYDCHSRISSLFIHPFHHVKHMKPSEAELEFNYISRHVVELLSS